MVAENRRRVAAASNRKYESDRKFDSGDSEELYLRDPRQVKQSIPRKSLEYCLWKLSFCSKPQVLRLILRFLELIVCLVKVSSSSYDSKWSPSAAGQSRQSQGTSNVYGSYGGHSGYGHGGCGCKEKGGDDNDLLGLVALGVAAAAFMAAAAAPASASGGRRKKRSDGDNAFGPVDVLHHLVESG